MVVGTVAGLPTEGSDTDAEAAAVPDRLAVEVPRVVKADCVVVGTVTGLPTEGSDTDAETAAVPDRTGADALEGVTIRWTAVEAEVVCTWVALSLTTTRLNAPADTMDTNWAAVRPRFLGREERSAGPLDMVQPFSTEEPVGRRT